MSASTLFKKIREKKSFLCVGLDTDYYKLPKFLLELEYPVFEFNKHIINSTAKYTVAFKINTAFYESLGAAGWISLELTVNYIKENYPDILIIADAKRSDIGNTAMMYAKTFFKTMDFDALTISPFMGKDSVEPFFKSENKWVIMLALTSNQGAQDFQFTVDRETGDYLFEKVLKVSKEWGNENNIMYVVGATKSELLKKIREIVPNHFLLVPGVGAQGGSLEEVALYGLNKQCGLLVNSSRDIIYADVTDRFAMVAGEKAGEFQRKMAGLLKERDLL